MKYALVIVLLFSVGCVLPSDIRSLQHAQENYRVKVDTELKLFKAGVVSGEELEASLQEATADQDEAIERVAVRVEERTKEVMDLVNQVADGTLSWPETLGGAGGVTTVGALILNAMRNSSRRKELADLLEE